MSSAALGFKTASQSNRILAWEQSKNLMRAYNEFLSGLLGVFIIGWRCALGKSFSVNVLENAYGAKLNEFAQLTGADDGAFYLIFRLAKPAIRNAIAHGTIWVDSDQNKVRFIDRGQENEMDLVEFLGLVMLGSYLGQAYLAAIATVMILEYGTPIHVAQLPQQLPLLFNHNSQ